jgi:serine/threonine protein kinase
MTVPGSGKRTFQGETSVDTMQAILRQSAPDLPDTIPAGLRQIVAHCPEKDPANRYQSAKDLAFTLAQGGGARSWQRFASNSTAEDQQLATCDRIPETGSFNGTPGFLVSMENKLMVANIGVASL